MKRYTKQQEQHSCTRYTILCPDGKALATNVVDYEAIKLLAELNKNIPDRRTGPPNRRVQDVPRFTPNRVYRCLVDDGAREFIGLFVNWGKRDLLIEVLNKSTGWTRRWTADRRKSK